MRTESKPYPVGAFDVHRAARFVVGQHGAAARAVALRRIEALLARGDVRGAKMWRSLLAPIDQLSLKRRVG